MPNQNELRTVVDFLNDWRYCPLSTSPNPSRECLEDSATQLLAALAAAPSTAGAEEPKEWHVTDEFIHKSNRAMLGGWLAEQLERHGRLLIVASPASSVDTERFAERIDALAGSLSECDSPECLEGVVNGLLRIASEARAALLAARAVRESE